MAIALVLVLVVAGSILFHLFSPWWWTPIASNWDYIDNTIIITFWITGIVFAAVVLFMAYCVWRFRHREGNTRALRAGEQAAGMVADRRSPASASPRCWFPACSSGASSSPFPRMRPRSRSSASSGSGASGCPARTASSAPPTRAHVTAENPLGLIAERSERPGRRHRRSGRPASAGRQAGQDAAALDRRAA